MGMHPSRLGVTIRSTAFVLAGAMVAVLLGVGAIARAQAAGPRADAVDRLQAIEEARLQALVNADTATAGTFMADDFELVNPGGAKLSKEDYLSAVEAGFIDYLVFEPAAPIDVHRSGNAAILRFPVRFDLVVAGIRLTHEGWITELYELRNGRWQIVWEQATAVPNDFNLFVESLKPPA